MDAAKQFFKQAVAVVGHAPEHVTTDGHRSYPRAVRETMGNEVIHRTNVYLNNCIEQDHRGMVSRTSRQQHAFVVHLTNYVSISVIALQQEKQCRWHNDGGHFTSVWQLCKN
jgi:transposase-like protein